MAKQYTMDDLRTVKAPDSIPSLIEWMLRRPRMYFHTVQEFEAGLYAAFSCYCMVNGTARTDFHNIWHKIRCRYSNRPQQVARMSDSEDWTITGEGLREVWCELCPPLNQLAEQA